MLRQIASKVRRRCERYVKNTNRNKLPSYSSAKNLECMCAIASALIFKELKKHKIKATFIEGYFRTRLYSLRNPTKENINHCWVEVNKKIIDVTLTQFGRYPKVIVSGKISPKYIKIFTHSRVPKLKEWPEDQRPISI